MYLLELSSEVFEFPILTNRSDVWPVYVVVQFVPLVQFFLNWYRIY